MGKPDSSREVVKEVKDSKQGMEKEIKKVKEGMETQQMLVEKIVGLQRACAKRQEKLDFLEEHVQQVGSFQVISKTFSSVVSRNQEEESGNSTLPDEP